MNKNYESGEVTKCVDGSQLVCSFNQQRFWKCDLIGDHVDRTFGPTNRPKFGFSTQNLDYYHHQVNSVKPTNKPKQFEKPAKTPRRQMSMILIMTPGTSIMTISINEIKTLTKHLNKINLILIVTADL